MTIAEVIKDLIWAEATLGDPYQSAYYEDALASIQDCIDYLDERLELFQKAEGR